MESSEQPSSQKERGIGEATDKTLFFDEKDYRRAVETLERFRHHVLCKFAIVGGIANRSLFPEWGERNRGRRLNDLDFVLLPSENELNGALLNSEIKTDFFVNYITPQKFDRGYYWSMIDKKDFVGVDIFTRTNALRTREAMIEGITYNVLTPEEIYLFTARDIYQTLNSEKMLRPHHVEFLNFLKSKIDHGKVFELWEREATTIQRVTGRSFGTLDQYLDQIDKTVVEKRTMIAEKAPGTAKREYNPNSVTAYGISIEDEQTFYASYEAKRRYLFDEHDHGQ